MPEKVEEILNSYTMNPATLRRVAETELHESPKTRKRALRELRDWLKAQPHISGCRTDNNFLLRFLRMKKFESAETIKVLDKYLKMRSQNPGNIPTYLLTSRKIDLGYFFTCETNGKK